MLGYPVLLKDHLSGNLPLFGNNNGSSCSCFWKMFQPIQMFFKRKTWIKSFCLIYFDIEWYVMLCYGKGLTMLLFKGYVYCFSYFTKRKCFKNFDKCFLFHRNQDNWKFVFLSSLLSTLIIHCTSRCLKKNWKVHDSIMCLSRIFFPGVLLDI